MLRRSQKRIFLQLITLALLFVMVFSSVAGVFASSTAAPEVQVKSSIPKYDNRLGKTFSKFARDYINSFSKPDLEKMGPTLKDFYNSKVPAENLVVRKDNEVSISVMTGPIPVDSLKKYMIVSNIFDAGFGKVVTGYINSADQALKIAQVPGVVHLEADKDDSRKKYSTILEEFQTTSLIKNRVNADPIYPQQYDTGDIIGTSRVISELGYDGSGVRISMYDTGVDFGQMDLGNDALARLFDGTPDVLDAVGEGLVLTSKVVTKNGSGYLNVSDIEASKDLTVWLASAKVDYYTYFAGLPPALQDMKAPSVDSQSGKYKFGLITQDLGYYALFPVVLVDSVTSGVYDTVVVDMETAVYLTGELLEVLSFGAFSYVQFPDVTYDEWDFSNDTAHRWGDGTEILAKDFNGDSINDFGAGMIGRTMDLYAALNGEPTLVEGINDTGTGFAIMYDNAGHGTLTASIAAGRGITPYPIFDNDFESVLFLEDNTTGFTLPGAAPGAKIQAIDTGGQSLLSAAIMSYFWAAGFDYNTGTKEWEWTGDHYANISSNSWGFSRLSNIAMTNYIAMVRDVLAVPGFYHGSYRGMLFVHSSGNDGSGMQTISASPATELMVGSSSKYSYHQPAYGQPQGYDQSSPYGSKGPSNLGMLRPDVLAPGWLIASPSPTWWAYNNIGSGNETFVWWAGTSASCPWGAGVAALVYEAYYDHHANSPNPDRVKTFIMSSAKDLGLNPAIQGHGQIDAFRAVGLAIGNTTFDDIPLLHTFTYTTFREVAKLVNETAVSMWAEGGLIENLGGNYPGAKNLTHITEHPGISNNFADASLYLGLINRGESKEGTITAVNSGYEVDSIVAKRFKETTTVTFTVTTNSSFMDANQGIGYFFPILIKKYLDSSELTAWNTAEFAWIHVSMPYAQRQITTSNEILYCTLSDWHDDGDGIPEYANASTAQIGEITEVSRYTNTEVNTWDLQVGKPGTAFPTGNPMVIVRSNSNSATASGFGGVQLTILVRMFTLEDWTDITVNQIYWSQWNVTATVGVNADPGIYEGVLVITKGAGEHRMPLSYMVTAPVPQGPSELVVGGASSDDSYDNFAFYIPYDISKGAYQGSDLKTYSLYVDDPNATFLAVNASWTHEDSAFNMWLFGPDLTRIGTSATEVPGGTAPTKNFYIFNLAQSSSKDGIYTLAIEGRDINMPPEILTLRIRYLTISQSEFPTSSATWSAANNTVLTGPNAPLTVSWSQFTQVDELSDLSIVGTKLAFVRGESVNETATFGGAHGFEDKTFTRTFTQGDVVNIRIGVAPFGPDLDTYVRDPLGSLVITLRAPHDINPEIGQFTVVTTGTYTITTEWWGYESAEGPPSNEEDEWVMYCYTDNFIFSAAESQTTSVTINTGTLGLDDGKYRVNAYALTGTSYSYIETHSYTLDNFLPPSVTVTSPNGGESVYSPVRINFTISDPNTDEKISWKIFYSKNGGASYYNTVIGSGTGTGDQTYEWVLDPGLTLGDNFKVKVYVEDEKGLSDEDESDNAFTISGPPAAPGFTILVALIVPVLVAIPILRKRSQKKTF
ncbi:MAG: S8 family serine peptidase [Candidatus Hermodarchaeota archaeon]